MKHKMWALTTSGPKGSLGTSHRMEVVPVSALILVCWPSSSSGNYILPDPNPPGKFSPFVCLLVIFFLSFCGVLLLTWHFFCSEFAFQREGRDGWTHWPCVLSSEKLQENECFFFQFYKGKKWLKWFGFWNISPDIFSLFSFHWVLAI